MMHRNWIIYFQKFIATRCKIQKFIATIYYTQASLVQPIYPAVKLTAMKRSW